ncbi:hypothetical protein A0J61_02419 [Choanephora cucurbitarum]|uniref:Uncharacterized protein n=1 Tax=Choanephora cucurbitarum TaxID=101091 RepID=A0A1C7NKJ1_9FUNG|nr:hypothetical protein A0J61_02419 [Choanephora cucurbitarum]
MISFVFICLFFITTLQALQVNFASSSSKDLLNRDSALSHYQSVLDDILSQHNEGLLTDLSMIIKDTDTMYAVLRPQASYLLEDPQDVCVAQMPGMIATQIHELSNTLYAQVDAIVLDSWRASDTEIRQLILNAINQGSWEQDVLDELADHLEMVNMEIADRLLNVVHEFDFLDKIKWSLVKCQAVFDAPSQPANSLTEKIWTAILVSLRNEPLSEDRITSSGHGLLNRYLSELVLDLQGELYGRTFELATSIYEDLAFNA